VLPVASSEWSGVTVDRLQRDRWKAYGSPMLKMNG
jgi:hypothetical protein